MKCRAKWIHKTYPTPQKGPSPLELGRLGIAEVLEGPWAPWPLMPVWQCHRLSIPLPSLLLLSNPLLVLLAVAPRNEMAALQLFPELYFSAAKLRGPLAQLSKPL